MRLRGIGPEVLLLCFLLVGAAAFMLGRRTARGRRLRRDLDYFAGQGLSVASGVGEGSSVGLSKIGRAHV